MHNDSVIIVAGGSGNRFGSDVPKQFLSLMGVPVLMHTLRLFFNFKPSLELILVLPEKHFSYWESLCEEHQFTLPHKVVAGGRERFHSVKNGLLAMQVGGIVAIHDAVRPLVSVATLQACFDGAEKLGNAIPSMPLVDSLRKVNDGVNKQVNRSDYRVVQTPQCFEKKAILSAFEQAYTEAFTDDASVFEAAGHTINLVTGNPENIKITQAVDLAIAQVLLGNKELPTN